MNIYVKNCNVKFYPGTETMNITEQKEPEIKAADDVIKEPDGVISTQRTYTLMDLNEEKNFAQTQLAQYLESAFKKAMNSAGIPADTCGLISNEEMFGKNALEYFKNGRNRIAFDFDDDYSRSYWISTSYDEETSGVYFCYASLYGNANYNRASIASGYVRPRFVIRKI